ncbi:MAG TPA: PaaX family transcriptional regulator C-terminal domain-containing protein [Sporichthyaceae bacterium]|nr:PaaX family transcriptional regulator C-terminal domain-containing protein [Sporichthyaceae bacterium]
MKARSLVFDLFGDYLRYRGGAVRLRALIELMGAFDVPEPSVRVVVTRMRSEGWLQGTRSGREASYGLTDASWRLLDEGRSRIFDRERNAWDGCWHMVMYQVPETERALREQMRKKLAWLGFGPMSASVWVSPHDRTASIRDEFGGHETVSLDVLHARSDGPAYDRDIALRCWDLAALDHDYAELRKQYELRLTRYRAGEFSGRGALTERMLLVHDYRMFPFRDPDLPLELLPTAWSGREAHEVFLEAHESLRGPAEAYVDEVLAG